MLMSEEQDICDFFEIIWAEDEWKSMSNKIGYKLKLGSIGLIFSILVFPSLHMFVILHHKKLREKNR